MMNSNQKKHQIIGGKIGLPEIFDQSNETPRFLVGEPILLFNARSGIKLVVDFLRPKYIWLPSYLCPTMLTGIDEKFSKIQFYSIDGDLKADSKKFVEQIQPGDLFLYIDYFGFTFDLELIHEIKERGAILFRDCSQALFTKLKNDEADFCLYSPRKFLGVPDGGILHIKKGIEFPLPDLFSPPYEILYPMFTAIILRREFDIFGGNRLWNEYFRIGEEKFIPSNYSMSELSVMLLKSAFDYNEIQTRRRNNFQTLIDKLKNVSLFNTLPKDVVPLGFPIKVKKRNQIQNFLFEKNIYPPIHWNIQNSVPDEFTDSHKLSCDILTLPCDQRYDEIQMNYMADILLGILSK